MVRSIAVQPISGAARDTQLTGRWLAIVRVTWVVAMIGLLASFATGLLPYYDAMTHACPDVCGMTEPQAAALANVSVSLRTFARISMALECVVVLISVILALILFRRRSRDWMVLLVALFLVGYPILNIGTTGGLPSNVPAPIWVLLQALTLPALPVYYATFLLFPNGRFVPRWTWILLVFWTFWGLVINFLPDVFGGLLFLGFPVFAISTIILQVYRYRTATSPIQRQQTKWAITGLLAVLVANQLFWLPTGFTPLGETLYMPISYLFYQLVILALPISFFIAIQRHRLYDIDTILNRALVYGSVTAILAAIYVGCIITFQAASRAILPIPGDSNEPITIVISTLVIAALFQPLRRRIQRAVDRRFYRTTYDARRAVEAFGATLRQEVDLTAFREQLLAVVQQTMEPEHVSLWLSAAPRDQDHSAS